MTVDYNNMNLPYKYELMNKLNVAKIPATVHLTDNKAFEFYSKYLLQKAMSVIDVTLPDGWELDYFLTVLFSNGFISIIDTEEFGVIPQLCTLSGYNIFYEPKAVKVANPLLPNIQEPLDIGTEAALIKLMPDFSGVLDIVSKYAAQLALCDETAEMNLINSQLSYVFAAKDKAASASFKEMYDRIHSGEPAVAVGKALFDDQGKPLWNTFTQSLASNFIAPDVISLKKKLEAEFDTIVGIPNANTDKRERLITDEVNANNVDTYCRAALWLDTIQRGVDEAIRLFPQLEGKFKIGWRAEPKEFGVTEEQGDEE